MDAYTAALTVSVRTARRALRAAQTASSRGGHELARSLRFLLSAKHLHKLGTEVAGGCLVLIGVAAWSVPCSLIIGGLALVAAIEMRSTQKVK